MLILGFIWGCMQKIASLGVVFKFWPQWPQFTIFDLMWPLMTSDVKITYHILFPDVIWVYMPKIASLSILIKAWWNTEQMLQHTNNIWYLILKSEVIRGHMRSKTVNWGHWGQNLKTTPRDAIFFMHPHMNPRFNIGYVSLASEVKGRPWRSKT